MKFSESMLGILVGLCTLPLCLIGMLVGLRGVGRYMRIKSM